MDKKRFGQFIKEARQAKNMTQADLAEQLFVDVTAVSKWERGVNFPDISMISDICKCLEITEHELIESSKDTEYRQTVYQSKQYVKNKKRVFWSFTSCFLVAILTCFIVNLSVSGTLSWFFIVLAGCACGYWAFFFHILFKRLKNVVSEGVWNKLKRFSLLIYVSGLLLLTLAILFTTNANDPFDVGFGVKVTLYCFIIAYIYGIIELFNVNRLIKLGIDSLMTGLYTLSLAWVLPMLMGEAPKNYFDVDFTDWAEHTDSNVACIILASFALIGIMLIVIGTVKRKHKTNG